MMLKRLRLQLTLLYLLAAVGLILVLDGGAYGLVINYFNRLTDQALAYKMALLYMDFNVPLNNDLRSALQNWQANESDFLRNRGEAEQHNESSEGHDGSEGSASRTTTPNLSVNRFPRRQGELYDAWLATIFVMPLDAHGQVMAGPLPISAPAPVAPVQAAWQAALKNGVDWRSVSLPSGERVRLLSYRVDDGGELAVLQLGRLMSDQDRSATTLLWGLTVLGLACVAALGLGSWWMAGRTLGPAQHAWDQQQQFVSNASHELRTPLTLIRATADYALRNRPSAATAESLHQIVDETDYMSHLVDDLLLLSRLDAHRLKLEHQAVPLEDLVGEAAGKVQKLAAEKGVRLQVGALPGSVQADPTRLRQVLLILLDNALRHTPSGGEIQIDGPSEGAPHGRMQGLAVHDTGEGIPPEHAAHVFERFYQVEPGSNENRSSGLGLSIARGLVEAMGGSIHLESQVGTGTTVSLWLPAAQLK